MKALKRKENRSMMLLLSLIFIFISCINERSLKDVNMAKKVSMKSNVETKDTQPRLRFNSMVRSIFEDSKGNFWFGSDYEGVCRYDGKSFAYFSTDDGLSHNQIRTIQEDQQGNIWFATGYGVSKYDGKKFTIQRAISNLMPSITPESKWKKEANDLWFNGEIEGGIYRYDGQNLELLEFPILDQDHESFSITGTVTGICEGKNNMLWMANYGGVIGYDGESFTFINERGLNYHVRSLFEDSKGNLWIGNNGIGVLRYDGNTTINFTEKKGVNDKKGQSGSITSPKGTLNHVFAIAEDRDGNIWFGDRDAGIWRYDGKTLINYTLKDGLPSMFARTIYTDKKGRLWIGTEGGSVCKFNGKSFDKMY